MNKRLRKKKHCGEFTEWGCRLVITRNRKDDNLFNLYRPLLDTLHFLDNSTTEPKLVFRDEQGRTTVYDRKLYNSIIDEVTR